MKIDIMFLVPARMGFICRTTTFCRVSNFSIQLMFSATLQPKTLPGKRDNVPPYEQNKIIWLVEMFSR
jgi:hypothetical protein